jgi:hypothetical protein
MSLIHNFLDELRALNGASLTEVDERGARVVYAERGGRLAMA